MYHSTIHGLVIRDSLRGTKIENPARQASSKLWNVPVHAHMRQPSPKPSEQGFLLFSRPPVPHTTARACMGRVGVNTGTRYLRESAEQPVREGLRKVYGSSGDNRPVLRVNRGVMRTLGLFVLFGCDEAERGWKRADTLVSPLAELWRNE